MRIEHFRYLFNREFDVFWFNENLALHKKPFNITNYKTGETVNFKTVDEMLDYKIDDETVREKILKLDKPFVRPLEGGRGAGSGDGSTVQKWRNASGGGGGGSDNDTALLPAKANVKIKSKTLEGALAEFKKNHLLADREFAYEVDGNGYVHQYKRGDSSSVAIGSRAKMRKGERTMIIHNHPNASAFSPADMLSTAADKRSKGIIASGKKYDYKFEKGTHFNATGFTKAVKNAQKNGIKGKDINDAVDKWLRANAKKYGYKYSRTKN